MTTLDPAAIELARQRTDVYGAATKLKRQGGWLIGRCPLHDDHAPSFAVQDGRWVCFSGCGHGDAIDFYRLWRHLNFAEAVRELAKLPPQAERRGSAAAGPRRRRERTEDDEERTASALTILRQAGPVTGTSAAWLYLWTRGLKPSAALRAHDGLWCTEAHTAFPALLGPVKDSAGRVVAIQRIWVLPKVDVDQAKDSRAPLKARKKTLGSMGDGCVRLAPAAPVMGLAEGIETALAAAALYHMPVWATLGANRLASVWLPPEVEYLAIFADRGEVGERTAVQACEEHGSRGIRYCTPVPPEPGFDDFNDQWLARQGVVA